LWLQIRKNVCRAAKLLRASQNIADLVLLKKVIHLHSYPCLSSRPSCPSHLASCLSTTDCSRAHEFNGKIPLQSLLPFASWNLAYVVPLPFCALALFASCSLASCPLESCLRPPLILFLRACSLISFVFDSNCLLLLHFCRYQKHYM
jgi:hypothetical protein